MTLQSYNKKRKFDSTPEPEGKLTKTDLSRFVIQEHWARNHHFDFRLEMDGVLKSWAVPKGVPQEKGLKHLAVAVEDHPVSYINFAGKIPEGNYGAGKVKIWDKGKYKIIKQTEKEIEFELMGKKLKGVYVLINFKVKNWLIFKR